MDALKKAELELDIEADRVCDCTYSAAAIALKRHWGWGKVRIRRLFEVSQEIWNECSATNEKSMVQMVQEETGIELQNGDGKSWENLPYLNEKVWNHRRPTRAQLIYIRQQQKKWLQPIVTGSIILALYRREKFGLERTQRFLQQVEEIKDEYGRDRKKLKAACEDIARVRLTRDENGCFGLLEDE